MSARLWWQVTGAVFIGVVLAVAFCLAIARLFPLLLLFGAGFLIAYLFDPLLDRLEARGWSRLQAVWLVTVISGAAVALLLAWIIPLAVEQVQAVAKAWPSYADRAQKLYETFRDWALSRMENIERAQQYAQTMDEQFLALQTEIGARLPGLLRWLSSRLLRSATWLLYLLIVVVVAFHFMIVIDEFREGIREMLPEVARPRIEEIASQASAMLTQYLRGLVVTSVWVGAFTAAGLGIVSLVFGTRYWLIIAIAAGLLYPVPWIGGAIADLIAVFLGYATAAHHPGWAALCSLGVVVAVNQAGDILVMPRIVGRRVGLHPLVVLFAILSGYSLFGAIGAMIATPAVVCLKIVLAHWLPVKGPAPTERAPSAPLDIDLRASVQRAYAAARKITERIENAIVGAQPAGEGDDSSGHPEDANA